MSDYFEIVSDNEYEIEIKCVNNIEDVVGICYSSEELNEMGYNNNRWGGCIRNNVNIKGKINEYVDKLKKSGKKSIIVDDKKLLDVIVKNGIRMSDYGVRRVGNKISMNDKIKKERVEYRFGDWSLLMNVFERLLNDNGCYFNLKIMSCSSSIKSVDLIKRMFSWDEIKDKCWWNEDSVEFKMMKKLYDENDRELVK